jgi:hypothetical protein
MARACYDYHKAPQLWERMIAYEKQMVCIISTLLVTPTEFLICVCVVTRVQLCLALPGLFQRILHIKKE